MLVRCCNDVSLLSESYSLDLRLSFLLRRSFRAQSVARACPKVLLAPRLKNMSSIVAHCARRSTTQSCPEMRASHSRVRSVVDAYSRTGKFIPCSRDGCSQPERQTNIARRDQWKHSKTQVTCLKSSA